MRILLYALGGLLALVVLVVAGVTGLLAYTEYSAFSPLTREIDHRVDPHWGDLVPLAPGPFAIQEPKAAVLETLAANQFERDYGTDWGSIRHPYQALLDAGHEMYVRHERHVVCNYSFYVLVHFDEGDQLTSVLGTARMRGCF